MISEEDKRKRIRSFYRLGWFWVSKMLLWEQWGIDFGTPEHHFGDPGIQGVTQQALRGPGVHFY